MAKIQVYTDGSYRTDRGSTTGHGAYAYLIVDGDEVIHSEVGRVYNTTNNKMELMAIWAALSHIEVGSDVVIYSDSQYAIHAITKWSHGWKRNNWLTMYGQPVKNRDLLEEILGLTTKSKVKFEWVRGHASNRFNNMVDKLVQTATSEMAKEKTKLVA